MKAIQLATLGIIPAALFLLACGDDVTKVTKIEETSGMEIVASADSLGKCTAEISGEMRFATKENAVYVCADSAWKNVSEAEKASCTAEALSDSTGFKIVCDGDSIGVVKNGEDGKAGAEGDAGKDGADGESCKLVDGPVREAGSSLVQTQFVICGGDTLTLSDGRPGENCELADGGDGTVSVTCGDVSTTLYKAFCGGKVYNPDSSFCVADSIVPLCGGESYDLEESFCFADSVVPLCDGKIYDLDSNFCLDGKVYKNKTLVWNLMNPEIEYGVFVDERDDQMYRSVKIGEQTWMAENLNYAYNQETSSLDSSSFCYNDEPDSCAKYGRLYLWSAAMDSTAILGDSGEVCGYTETCASADSATMVRGVCPAGWHLPGKAEFETLHTVISATNDFGFSILPTGYRFVDGSFYEGGGIFWSSDESEANYAYLVTGSNANRLVFKNDKRLALSVRCVKD